MAERAHRVIHMKDGHVDREETKRRRGEEEESLQASLRPMVSYQQFINYCAAGHRTVAAQATIWIDLLGIIFGVCSVIAMLAIIEVLPMKPRNASRRLGNNIIVRSVKPPDEAREQNNSGGRSRGIRYGLTYDDTARIYSTIPGVERVLPMRLIRERIRFFEIELPCQVIGTLSFYPDIVSIDLIKGRFLSLDEVYKQNVCVLTTSGSAIVPLS